MRDTVGMHPQALRVATGGRRSPLVLALVPLAVAALLLCGATALADVGDVMAYAQATGSFKQATRPTLYQPLHMLDGKEQTAWCSPSSDPLNELLSFGFKRAVGIEALRISSGDGKDDASFAAAARPKRIVVRAGRDSRTIELDDARGAQSIPLSPPLVGARVTVEILESYLAADIDAPVCISDVVFVSEGHALNGPWLSAKLKYDKHVAALMGPWFAGFEGTPDRFLTFHFDRTFRYSFEPFDTSRSAPREIVGSYDASAGRLVFTVDGKRLSTAWDKKPLPKGNRLRLDGELPPELKQDFRSAP